LSRWYFLTWGRIQDVVDRERVCELVLRFSRGCDLGGLPDLDGLAASCRAGRALGFLGRSAIHPRQLSVIAAAFRPTAGEVAHARAVLHALAAADAAGRGTALLPDGRFVDRAMAPGARRVLHLAARYPDG
jgi:citrate lyase beta subunit